MDLPTRSGPPAVEPHPAGCHLCGSTTGPLLPDPIAGNGKLICSRGCQPAPTTDAAAKDTRTAGESTLSSDVLAFLAAVRDALTVPRPARVADFAEMVERRHRREELIADRATAVRIAAQLAVDLDPGNLQTHLTALTQTIRDNTAAHPVEFEVREDPEAPAGTACAACRRPFDPADTRFDGHARHRDTPYCRACVDRCHDNEIADHRCPICARGAL
ncbi:hypothetical protein [Streptomyces sp. NPDC020983]|uniref:hypothetical protein n=1 Tax=Streptomyces sp. NPDC020983 TaxID=3365106 RepID=UPI0037AAB3F6